MKKKKERYLCGVGDAHSWSSTNPFTQLWECPICPLRHPHGQSSRLLTAIFVQCDHSPKPYLVGSRVYTCPQLSQYTPSQRKLKRQPNFFSVAPFWARFDHSHAFQYEEWEATEASLERGMFKHAKPSTEISNGLPFPGASWSYCLPPWLWILWDIPFPLKQNPPIFP